MKGRSLAYVIQDREWQREEARKATATRDRVIATLIAEGRDIFDLSRATGLTEELITEIAAVAR